MTFLSYHKQAIFKVLFAIMLISSSACKFSYNNSDEKKVITVFHAGSLSIPLNLMAREYEQQNPGVSVHLEASGSVTCVRKIIDLKRNCDLIALADYSLIDKWLIPAYADWAIQFASNEMCLAFKDESLYADEISENNWFEIILKEDVRYGRSNPDSDPCGYRTVLTLRLADSFYQGGVNSEEILAKDQRYIRPKETDLLALLETHSIDYMFTYSSLAMQHNLNYIKLPDSINLGNPDFSGFYSEAAVMIAGKEPGSELQIKGQAMIYGFTVPKIAQNPDLGNDFARFILNPEFGLKIIEESGQKVIDIKLSPATISNPQYITGQR